MEFKLPELGEGVHEGELVKWKVKPGELVKYDQPLCDVMTDKATMEVPSAFEGKVDQLHVKEGETVKVGQLMLSFAGAASQAKASSGSAKEGKAAQAPMAAMPAPRSQMPTEISRPAQVMSQVPAGAMAAGGPVLAAPSTRRIAREMGIDIAKIPGSGPHGRVLREDLQRSNGTLPSPMAPVQKTTPRVAPGVREEHVPFRGLRKKISEKMRLSKDKAAHFTYVEEADASELVKLRTSAKEIGNQKGIKVTYLPFIMKAMVAALREYPILNSSLDEERGEIILKHYYNIGLSIQTEEGLTAPVIKNVESKSIFEIAQNIQDVVNRARTKHLTLDDFHDSTITLTNAGTIGGLFATPVINYPEVAILGFNKIFRKPVVKEMEGREQVVIRDWTYFSLSLDHRVVDGAIGAEFMNLFIKYIENPALLLLDLI